MGEKVRHREEGHSRCKMYWKRPKCRGKDGGMEKGCVHGKYGQGMQTIKDKIIIKNWGTHALPSVT